MVPMVKYHVQVEGLEFQAAFFERVVNVGQSVRHEGHVSRRAVYKYKVLSGQKLYFGYVYFVNAVETRYPRTLRNGAPVKLL